MMIVSSKQTINHVQAKIYCWKNCFTF